MLQANFSSHTLIKHHRYTSSRPQKDIVENMMPTLARLSQQQQWILFTAECPRPQYQQFASFNIHCDKVVHMKPSQAQSELEIVIKAIRSGNASAVIASNGIEAVNQALLKQLATEHQCEVFFVEGRHPQFH
ncbi:SulA-like leucine-rich domain-containing protein [Vibrio aestuarianus]|uniref:Superfamily II DNA and RNA helicase n=1 Tax=Vibrio aestuarianus TaxID=28171 RepID=A0A9X4ITG8_9VIBR|nr:SulA-like leucine-rich domain-containing protein [Vibrio aestuarianus]MDE1242115.1 hypothetical protein [Vibrio aestuarianus]